MARFCSGHRPRRRLRSVMHHLLAVQRYYRLYTYGCREFSVAAPSDLEFTAGRSSGSSTESRLLQTTAEDDTFLVISAFSALGVFYCRCALQIEFDMTFDI